MSEDRNAREAVAIALRVHDEAMAMNREHGFEMFDVSAAPEAFIAALEAQDPPWTVAPDAEVNDRLRRIEAAASRMLGALEHKRDVINGQGHPGEDHDTVLREPRDPKAAVHIYDTVGDCAACGGAQYAADDLENAAWGDLRASLGLERYQWQPEYPSEAFRPLSPLSPEKPA